MITIKKTLCVDATAVLKDTLGTTISTTPIASGASADITAPDGTAENSDATYSVLVPSGSTVIMPNINFTDSDGITTSVPSNKDITATLCGGGASISTATLMRTGLTTIFRTGDDADTSSEGRATDFFTLASNNPFGNTNRFTDELGGSTYTKDIVIDWSTFNGSTVLGYYRIAFANAIWNDAIDNCLALSITGFTSGWRLTNVNEILNVMSAFSSRALSYSPINQGVTNDRYWTSSNPTGQPAYIGQQFLMGKLPDTQLNKGLPCRTFTVTGTVLT